MNYKFTSMLWRSSLCVIAFFMFTSAAAQDNQWAWISGSDTPFQGNVYGVKGVSASTNTPGGRWAARTWTDDAGNLWMHGGHEGQQDSDQGFRNDLWKYNISANRWTWMSGDSTIDNSSVYGVKGISSSSNKPGARAASEAWKDDKGNLWLFGGGGYVAGVQGFQNDVWKYNIASNEWTWVAGDTLLNESGIYGTKGVPSAANRPGSRVSGVSWSDHEGNFWIFGGLGYGATDERGALNDLWKFDITTLEWTWLSGDMYVNQAGVFGSKGVASTQNKPGGKEALVGWTDEDGKFWLFGGYGFSNIDLGWMNDLWRYDPSTNLWTWIRGEDFANPDGVYGTKGEADPQNEPGGRSSSSSFVGKDGDLWLFAGYIAGQSDGGRINDLWRYDRQTNEWTWVSGDNNSGQEGEYGFKGVSAPANTPGYRDEPMPWTDNNGNLWMFGGRYSYEEHGVFNDLWKFETTKMRNGVCCFTGGNGQMMACGPHVTAVNCMGSGVNAFFVGFVNSCTGLDPTMLCSITADKIVLSGEYVADDKSVLLAWSIEPGHQTKGFFIQRSRDGKAFKTIDFVPVDASGNYDFTDINPMLKAFYKVVWFEQQGFESNKVLTVAMEESNELQLFPNPATSAQTVRVLLSGMDQHDMDVAVYSNTGNQVLVTKFEKGRNNEIDLSTLIPGLYYLTVEMDHKTYHSKIVKE